MTDDQSKLLLRLVSILRRTVNGTMPPKDADGVVLEVSNILEDIAKTV